MDYLTRGQAPFANDVWEQLDKAAIAAARDLLTGRRFLPLEGPFGIGLTAIEYGEDDYYRQPGPDEAAVVMGRAVSVPMIRKIFHISTRRIAANLENQQPLDLSPVEDAAEAVAEREEDLIYRGVSDFHLPGLLTCDGHQTLAAGDWSAVERALDDVLAATTLLDDEGYRGPYALALSPPLYNGLFRLYPGTDVLQLEHLRRLCTRGIYKASIEGGVLVDPRAGTLILGQDLRSGYVGQDGVHYQLYLMESLALRIDDPKAICTIPASYPALRGGRDDTAASRTKSETNRPPR
jgi:uncharacterized linocin/CFP29 family protein